MFAWVEKVHLTLFIWVGNNKHWLKYADQSGEGGGEKWVNPKRGFLYPPKNRKNSDNILSLAVVECGENKISHFLWSIREKDDDFT